MIKLLSSYNDITGNALEAALGVRQASIKYEESIRLHKINAAKKTIRWIRFDTKIKDLLLTANEQIGIVN